MFFFFKGKKKNFLYKLKTGEKSINKPRKTQGTGHSSGRHGLKTFS